MNFDELANLLFPNIDKTPEYYEEKYPPRQLKDGARVTRFAPSPTGYLHFGNLYTCFASYLTARNTDGVFFVRVEDTDQKRKVDGAVDAMLKGLEVYGVKADEGVIGEETITALITKVQEKIFTKHMQKILLSRGLHILAFALPMK